MSPENRARKAFDPFRVLSRAERERHLADYQRFLHERDGDCDEAAFTLTKREAYFSDLDRKPVRWRGDVDHDGFDQHLRGTGAPPLSPRMVFLVASAKGNLSEAYGVAVELDSFRRKPHRAKEDPLFFNLMVEELYHTRILDELCRSGGVEPVRQIPDWLQRVMIHGMMYLPDRIRWILIFAGEVLGSEVFRLLNERVELFAAEPEVQQRLRELLHEIWVDEVYHVAYLRAKIGPIGIRIARWLMPLITMTIFKTVPQGWRIGLTREAILERLRGGIEMPSEIDWMHPDPVIS